MCAWVSWQESTVSSATERRAQGVNLVGDELVRVLHITVPACCGLRQQRALRYVRINRSLTENTMADQHRPGEIVNTSGIYKVVRESAEGSFEVTCVGGEHILPTRGGKGAHYELLHAVTHSHKHSELGSGD